MVEPSPAITPTEQLLAVERYAPLKPVDVASAIVLRVLEAEARRRSHGLRRFGVGDAFARRR